jgi:Domain of unknown function (DUF4336)
LSYPPLDTLKPIADGVHIVDSELPGLKGTIFPARMTIIRLPEGSLILYSPTRFTERLRRELDRLGEVRHLVAPSTAHWMFVGQWQTRYPEATTWAVPGLRDRSGPRRQGLRLDRDLPTEAPSEWAEDIALVMIEGALGYREAALFHRPSRTLTLTDLAQNLEPSHLPLAARPVPHLLGIAAPHGGTPVHLRALLYPRRAQVRKAAHRLLALEPERVIFAHGAWFQEHGAETLRRTLRWLIPAPRAEHSS